MSDVQSGCQAAGKETAQIELTEAQQRQLDRAGWPPQVHDPRTGEPFVLIHQELFERVRVILAQDDEIGAIEEMVPLVSEADSAEENA